MLSYILVPQDIFNEIKPRVQQLVYDYSWSHNLVDCDDRAKFPDLSFTIGGVVFNVTAMEYIWKTVRGLKKTQKVLLFSIQTTAS